MTVTLTRTGSIATVTLNRPEKKNALDLQMRIELPRVFEQIQNDVSIRTVVLTGSGVDFCAGADVREMGGGGIADSMTRVEVLHRMVRALIRTDTPDRKSVV